MSPCWCFLGDFLKFAKLISSQNLTKYRSLKNFIFITSHFLLCSSNSNDVTDTFFFFLSNNVIEIIFFCLSNGIDVKGTVKRKRREGVSGII
jgi:hypothetical protein